MHLARVVVFGVFAIFAGGCWQEIEYTGPDSSSVARRERPRPETNPPAEVEPSDDDVDEVREHQPPTAEPEPPSIAAELPESEPDDPTPEEDEIASSESLAEEPTADLFPLDEVEPASEPPATEPEAIEPPAAEPPPPSAAATRLAAWQLGSKLTVAALAHDRGLVPGDVEMWLKEANAAAQTLDTSVGELPEAGGEEQLGGSRRIHDYLFQQGQRIYGELTDRYGADHAALFEVAVKSSVLLVLYEPGSSSVEALANSIRAAAPQAGLPPELWNPLLEQMAEQPPPAAVRLAVRQMHADVERHLAQAAE